MATYSAFFSSGLLAPCVARVSTPTCSTVPIPSSPVDPVDRELSTTPTPITTSSTACAQAIHAINATAIPAAYERPRMRRRRSSINVAVSPIATIKSPTRNVTKALHRSGMMSPTRSRAGSVNEASENNSLFGRLRSGSIGGLPPLRTRKAGRRTVPLAPPPTIPLPAVPLTSETALSPPAICISIPRWPLSPCASPVDNVPNPVSPALASPMLLVFEHGTKTPLKMSPSRASSPVISENTYHFGDAEMKDN